MKILNIITSAVLIVGSLESSGRAEDKWLLIPGQSIGAIKAQTSFNELVRVFGKKNVTKDSCDAGDDEHQDCIHVKQAGVIVATIFDDGDRRNVVLDHGNWHTEEGVTFGTPVSTLERINGKPFKVWRFHWDFATEIKSWDGGKLAGKWDETLAVRLSQSDGFSASKSDKENQDLKRELLDMQEDDALFSSNLPSISKLKLHVIEFVVSLKR